MPLWIATPNQTAMSSLARYWKLIKLDGTGRSRPQELPQVKAFVCDRFADLPEQIEHGLIQRTLMDTFQSDSPDRTLAELSLRCFISSQIEQVCTQLELQFGEQHGLRRSDLYPFVLDDDGSTQPRPYQPLAQQILASFDPQRGSLTTWTIRLVKHHRDLNRYLLECGIYLLSDWALLNDTAPKKLDRILSSWQPLTPPEIQQAQQLLASYHAVYRRDRLTQRQAGIKGQCPPPTDAQLAEMAQLLQSEGLALSPTAILRQLRGLADRLRQYRIWARGGSLKTASLDEGETFTLADRIADRPPEAEDPSYDRFLHTYRQAFLKSLEQALQQVVLSRSHKLKPPKSQHFLHGLQLFHCQGLSMTDIAQQVGLEKQFQVTRLLNLKALREDVRHEMLRSLQALVVQQAAELVSPDRLSHLDDRIASALNEQIETLMADEAARAQTPKTYAKGSLFAKTLCQYLDTLPNLAAISAKPDS